jgi:hypothetical protein
MGCLWTRQSGSRFRPTSSSELSRRELLTNFSSVDVPFLLSLAEFQFQFLWFDSLQVVPNTLDDLIVVRRNR